MIYRKKHISPLKYLDTCHISTKHLCCIIYLWLFNRLPQNFVAANIKYFLAHIFCGSGTQKQLYCIAWLKPFTNLQSKFWLGLQSRLKQGKICFQAWLLAGLRSSKDTEQDTSSLLRGPLRRDSWLPSEWKIYSPITSTIYWDDSMFLFQSIDIGWCLKHWLNFECWTNLVCLE